MSVADASCLIIPDKCVGLPTLAAQEQGIPVIAVKENRNRMQNRLDSLPFEKGKLIFVDNYLEAAGVMRAIKVGVSIESLRRPLTFSGNFKLDDIIVVLVTRIPFCFVILHVRPGLLKEIDSLLPDVTAAWRGSGATSRQDDNKKFFNLSKY